MGLIEPLVRVTPERLARAARDAPLKVAPLAPLTSWRQLRPVCRLRQVQALVKERNELQLKVEWQFSITQAREKLSRHYEQVKSKN